MSRRSLLILALGLAVGFSAFVGSAGAAVSLSWSVGHVTGAGEIAHMDCPSAEVCVATDFSGNVLASAAPTSGAGSWSLTHLGSSPLNGVSCPTASLCVTSNINETVYHSTGPTSGSWLGVSPAPIFYAVSCPSTTLCVGGVGGGVVTSTDPTGPADAWSFTAIHSPGEPAEPTIVEGISCAPSTSTCVAREGTNLGDLLVTTDPTGGGAWTRVDPGLGDDPDAGVSCPSPSLCVVAWDEGVATSTDPTGGAGTWTKVTLPGAGAVQEISCPSTTFCAAADYSGNVFTSTDPTRGASAWTAVEADPGNPVLAVSCISESLCFAADAAGNVLVGTPSGAPPSAPNPAPAPGQPVAGSGGNAPPVAPTPPSNRFFAPKKVLTVKDGVAELHLSLPGPGKVTVTGTGIKKATAVAKKTGRIKVALKPKAATLASLKAKGKSGFKVTIAFTPTGGSPNAVTTTLRLLA